jgi:hypothetical protein
VKLVQYVGLFGIVDAWAKVKTNVDTDEPLTNYVDYVAIIWGGSGSVYQTVRATSIPTDISSSDTLCSCARKMSVGTNDMKWFTYDGRSSH